MSPGSPQELALDGLRERDWKTSSQVTMCIHTTCVHQGRPRAEMNAVEFTVAVNYDD